MFASPIVPQAEIKKRLRKQQKKVFIFNVTRLQSCKHVHTFFMEVFEKAKALRNNQKMQFLIIA